MTESEAVESEIRVVVMEDHRRLCDVLKRTITLTPGMVCCGHFHTGQATLDALPELEPDVISIDLSMPDLNGLAVLRQICEEFPDIICTVFSGHADEAYVRQAFDSGARGYVFKEDVGDFIHCIREVASGKYFLSPRFEDSVPLPESD